MQLKFNQFMWSRFNPVFFKSNKLKSLLLTYSRHKGFACNVGSYSIGVDYVCWCGI